METLTLNVLPSPLRTEIYFGRENLASVCHALSKRGVILADSAIASSHAAEFQKQLGYELIAIPTGEKNKTRADKEALENALLKKQFGRDAVIVAVGGGMTTDLVGYLASNYMRGVPLILIPTTLLGMVDAAIGGKTGVNTPFGKNLIGAFYLPKAIFIDFDVLKTLPEIEMKNGLSEILKYGLIDDRAIWDRCYRWKEEIEFLIRASIACKIKVVTQDFEEKKGLRRILNFGHTVGHALELISHFQMSHGEAVALGCMAESYLSHSLGYLSTAFFERILAFYQNLGYRLKKTDSQAFLDAVILDKKAKGGEVRFVFIDQIGRCVPFDGEYCRTVDRKELEQIITWMNHA